MLLCPVETQSEDGARQRPAVLTAQFELWAVRVEDKDSETLLDS